MSSSTALSRRFVLLGLASGFLAGMNAFAYAEDDNEGGGGENSGGGDDGDGEDISGGGDGSTTGNGGAGNAGGNTGQSTSDQNRAQDAVNMGKAMPLAKAFDLLSARVPGRVIEVLLITKGSGLDYRFKVIDDAGNVTVATMDAVTGHFRNRFGF